MKVKIVGKKSCTFCEQAVALSDLRKIDYEYVDFETMGHDDFLQFMEEKCPSAKTFPIILVDDEYVGGFAEYKKILDGGS